MPGEGTFRGKMHKPSVSFQVDLLMHGLVSTLKLRTLRHRAAHRRAGAAAEERSDEGTHQQA
jgi:hypothetical protein